jgi:hypothetical protein
VSPPLPPDFTVISILLLYRFESTFISLPCSIFSCLLRLNLTFFVLYIYLRFFCKVLSFLWLVYYTCTHSKDYLLLFSCRPFSLLSFIFNRHSLNASDTIITYIRVKSADVRFLQTSFVLCWLLQYFECTQPEPWGLGADSDTCQLHFQNLHTIQASVLLDRWHICDFILGFSSLSWRHLQTLETRMEIEKGRNITFSQWL